MKKYIAKKLKIIKEVMFGEESKNIEKALQEKALQETVEFITTNKLTKLYACNTKYDLLNHAINSIINKEGLYLEFGVYQGYTINHISQNIGDNTIYGFDSFEGLPEDWRTGYSKGTFATQLPQVNDNVVLIKGWFNDVLPGFIKEHKNNISFLHIDCDLYSSTKTIFDSLKEKIGSGTVIVFDEYWNYSDRQNGEYKAFQEFIEKTGHKFEYLGYNQLHEQVAIKIL